MHSSKIGSTDEVISQKSDDLDSFMTLLQQYNVNFLWSVQKITIKSKH